MKGLNVLLAAACIAAAFAFSSCDAGGEGGENAKFLDTPLQGTFNGKSFAFISGYAEKNETDGTYVIKLYNIPPATASPWDDFAYFGATNLMVQVEVASQVRRTELFLDLDTLMNKTVRLSDSVGGRTILAYIGAVEITSIDLAAGTIAGRIAASDDEGNAINGNFTVPIEP